MTIAILPEWNSRPDMVLYSWAGAKLPWSSGTSCIPSMKVELLRRYRGALTAISAVLQLLATSSAVGVYSVPWETAWQL
jgi:hypothetical protein